MRSSTTTDISNTLIGFETGNDNTTGYENTFIGQKLDIMVMSHLINLIRMYMLVRLSGENLDDIGRNVGR